MLIKKSVILMLALLLSACGYHLRGALDLPAGMKNVYLEGGSAQLRDQFTRAMEYIFRAACKFSRDCGNYCQNI